MLRFEGLQDVRLDSLVVVRAQLGVDTSRFEHADTDVSLSNFLPKGFGEAVHTELGSGSGAKFRRLQPGCRPARRFISSDPAGRGAGVARAPPVGVRSSPNRDYCRVPRGIASDAIPRRPFKATVDVANYQQPSAGATTARSRRTIPAEAASRLQASAKFLYLLVRLIPGDTVTFLDLSGEVFAIALGDLDIVISQLAPLRLELAGELFPLSLDLVFVHEDLRMPMNRRTVVNGRVMQQRVTRPFWCAQ